MQHASATNEISGQAGRQARLACLPNIAVVMVVSESSAMLRPVAVADAHHRSKNGPANTGKNQCSGAFHDIDTLVCCSALGSRAWQLLFSCQSSARPS
eukprot:654773-Amphidinium_carterae.1